MFQVHEGCFSSPLSEFKHTKLRNGAMAHLQTACGPPVGNHCFKAFPFSAVASRVIFVKGYHFLLPLQLHIQLMGLIHPQLDLKFLRIVLNAWSCCAA